MSVIATTGSNALRGYGNAFGVVRYWTYTKYPFGHTWEANFPTTIYLVGCKPSWSVFLYCVDDTSRKVVYHRGSCSIVPPESNYIYSWDRKTLCPWTDATFCGDLETPPDAGNVVDGVGNAIFDVCVSFPNKAGFTGPYIRNTPGGPSVGFVEPAYSVVDGICVPDAPDVVGDFSFLTDGLAIQDYNGGSGDFYICSNVTLGINAVTKTAHVWFAHIYPYGNIQVAYSGEADMNFDPETGGTASVPVYGEYVATYMPYTWTFSYCDDFASNCNGAVECLFENELQIIFTIVEPGECT